MTSTNKKFLYWHWIESESQAIESDGCSKVPDFYVDCCKMHDLAYYYAKCPQSAFKHYLADHPAYWIVAKNITKASADVAFRKCIQSKSALKWFSPMSWWRWTALKLAGQAAWDSHRNRERDEQEHA